MVLIDEASIDEARGLREVIYLRLLEWKPELKYDTLHLNRYVAKLVNHFNEDCSFYKIVHPFDSLSQQGVSSDTLMKMRALSGPHGYAIWRALQIAKE